MAGDDNKPKGDHAFTAQGPRGTVVEPMYSGATSFLRRKYSRDLTGIDVAVSGIPFDLATTGRSGARLGPQAIRRASVNLAWERHFPSGQDIFEQLSIVDYGDLVFDPGYPERVPAEIEAHARTILDAGAAMLTLGGDHFVTYPILKAHAEKYGPLALVHFDAHSDSWEEDGRRIDHGTMFYHAAKEGLVDPAASVQIGIRAYNAKSHGYTVLDAPWVHAHRPDEVAARIREVVGDRKAYLTFDIDGLDPSCAPGTGTPVVGGLNTAQALAILGGLKGIDFVGGDVVEVAPAYDVSDITALAGATIGLEFLHLYSSSPSRRG